MVVVVNDVVASACQLRQAGGDFVVDIVLSLFLSVFLLERLLKSL